MNLFTTTRVLSAGAFVALLSTAASAQGIQSSCSSATGLSATGQPCYTLTPTQRDGQNPGSVLGTESVARVSTSELGETYECRRSDNQDYATGTGTAALIEDCGAPLQITNTTDFFYSTPAAQPAPVVAAAPPPPPPPPPAALPPVVPAAAPAVVTSGISGVGLAGAGPLLVGGLAAAALGGIIWAIADDDDGNSTTSTSGTTR